MIGNSQGDSLDESSPLESNLYERDGYAISKTWQERLVRRTAEANGWNLTILRPGFIWGADHELIAGIGQSVGNWHVVIGGRRPLPLTYVENCAECFLSALEVFPFEPGNLQCDRHRRGFCLAIHGPMYQGRSRRWTSVVSALLDGFRCRAAGELDQSDAVWADRQAPGVVCADQVQRTLPAAEVPKPQGTQAIELAFEVHDACRVAACATWRKRASARGRKLDGSGSA